MQQTDTGKYEVAVAAPPSVGSAMHAVLIDGCVRWLGLGSGLGLGHLGADSSQAVGEIGRTTRRVGLAPRMDLREESFSK